VQTWNWVKDVVGEAGGGVEEDDGPEDEGEDDGDGVGGGEDVPAGPPHCT
jgi:hypothetical protein